MQERIFVVLNILHKPIASFFCFDEARSWAWESPMIVWHVEETIVIRKGDGYGKEETESEKV